MSDDPTALGQSLFGRVGRTMFHLGLGQAASWLIRPVTIVLISRSLGPASSGRLVVALAVWSVVGLVFDFGAVQLLPREIAQQRALAWPMTAGALRVVGSATVLTALIGLGAGLALGAEAETMALHGVVGVGIAFTRLAMVFASALRGLEQTAGIATGEIVAKLTELAAVIGLIVVSDELVVLAAGLAVGPVVHSAALGHFFRRAVRPSTGRERIGRLSARVIARRAASLMVFGLTVVGYRQIDVLVMSRLVEERAIGWYGAADRLYGSGLFVTTIGAAALYPIFSQLSAEDDPRLIELLRRALVLLTTAGLAIGLGTWLVGPQIVPLLFGDPFAEGGDVLAVFGLALIPSHATILFGTYAVATRQVGRWGMVQVGAIAGTVGLDLILVPLTDRRYDNGALGGAWSYVIVEIAILAVGVPLVAPGIIDRMVVSALARAGVAGGVMVVATRAVAGLPLVGEVVVGGVVFAAMIVLLRVISRAKLRALRAFSKPPAGAGCADSPGERAGESVEHRDPGRGRTSDSTT